MTEVRLAQVTWHRFELDWPARPLRRQPPTCTVGAFEPSVSRVPGRRASPRDRGTPPIHAARGRRRTMGKTRFPPVPSGPRGSMRACRSASASSCASRSSRSCRAARGPAAGSRRAAKPGFGGRRTRQRTRRSRRREAGAARARRRGPRPRARLGGRWRARRRAAVGGHRDGPHRVRGAQRESRRGAGAVARAG